MNTHPDVLWELVKDHQARLREEAQQQNRVHLLARGRSRAKSAGTLAACEAGAAD